MLYTLMMLSNSIGAVVRTEFNDGDVFLHVKFRFQNASMPGMDIALNDCTVIVQEKRWNMDSCKFLSSNTHEVKEIIHE